MGTLDSTNQNAPSETVTDVSGVSSRQRKKKLFLCSAFAVALAAFLWAGYIWYGKQKLDEHRLELAFEALSASSEQGLGKTGVEYLRAQPREKMLLDTFEVLNSPIKNIDDQLRLNGARAALDLAIANGSREARLVLGKAFRDGIFGQKDSVAALREFERVSSNVESGIKAGDSNALYVYALMLHEGLGIPLNQNAATAMMTRAAEGMDGWRLKSLGTSAAYGFGVFKDVEKPKLASQIARRLVKAGDHSAYTIGVASCDKLHETDKQRNACEKQWVEDAAIGNYKPAMSDYAQILLRENGATELASDWYEAAGTDRTNRENYNYGVVKAVLARNLDTFTSAVRMMWEALEKDKNLNEPWMQFSSDALGLSLQMEKALAKNEGYSRSNFVMALLAQGELESKKPETIRAEVVDIVDMKYLRTLIDSQGNRRTALLVAEAVRTNRTFTQVAEAQLQRNVSPFSINDLPVSVKSAGASPAPASAVALEDAKKPAIQRSSSDPEQQAKTGYLAGAPSAASGGLSTFTVDNSTGERDAVVRLYLDGKKPAARSMYIKLGEKFTSKSLTQGTYTMRYRFIGGTDTFEAEKPFELSESKTETGRRFSNVTVTLYKVRDGNMKSRKVSADEF